MFVVKQAYYDSEPAKRFISDMELAALQPHHFRGPNRWQGPAVTVDSLEEGERAMTSTAVACNIGKYGQVFAVYPEGAAFLNAEGHAAYQAYLDRDDGED